MVILVDMDDTIEQMLVAWVKSVNEVYGTNVSYDDISDWDVSAAFDGLNREQVYGVITEDEFWENVEPMPYAPEVLKKLIEYGDEVYIVTATPYRSIPSKMDHLLFKYFPFIKWENVIVTSRKQLLKADVMIDDGPHNLVGGCYRKILVSCPHNRNFDATSNGMIRVDNWHEIEKILESFRLEL